MELRRIAKNGHSLQVVLPRKYLAALSLRRGDVVAIELVNQTIVVSRAVSEREFTGARPAPRS